VHLVDTRLRYERGNGHSTAKYNEWVGIPDAQVLTWKCWAYKQHYSVLWLLLDVLHCRPSRSLLPAFGCQEEAARRRQGQEAVIESKEESVREPQQQLLLVSAWTLLLVQVREPQQQLLLVSAWSYVEHSWGQDDSERFVIKLVCSKLSFSFLIA